MNLRLSRRCQEAPSSLEMKLHGPETLQPLRCTHPLPEQSHAQPVSQEKLREILFVSSPFQSLGRTGPNGVFPYLRQSTFWVESSYLKELLFSAKWLRNKGQGAVSWAWGGAEGLAESVAFDLTLQV